VSKVLFDQSFQELIKIKQEEREKSMKEEELVDINPNIPY
jgi:hypothetical protein